MKPVFTQNAQWFRELYSRPRFDCTFRITVFLGKLDIFLIHPNDTSGKPQICHGLDVNPHFRQKHSAAVILFARKHQKTPGKHQKNIRKNIRKHQLKQIKNNIWRLFLQPRKVFEKEDKALPSGATHFPDPDGLRSHGRAVGRARVKRNTMLMHIHTYIHTYIYIYLYCIYTYIYIYIYILCVCILYYEYFLNIRILYLLCNIYIYLFLQIPLFILYYV